MPFSADKLRELRTAKGLERKELAALVGTTAKYISHLENGSKDNPAFDLVEKLGAALGVTCEAFRVDEPTTPPVKKAAPPKGKPKK